MFGSKQLLIAFAISACGNALAMFAVNEVEGIKAGVFSLGLLLVWVSALFGGFLASAEVFAKQTTSVEE